MDDNSTRIGPISALGFETHQIIGDCGREQIYLMHYEEGIIRVLVSDADLPLKPLNYALTDELRPKCIDYLEHDNKVVVSTPILDVTVNKSPLSIVFANKNGRVINEDDHGLGMRRQGSQVSCYKKLQTDEKFIGLGEKTGPLNKRGHSYINWNTDKFGYGVEEDPLYCSVPFYIGIHSGLTYGIFFNNSYQTRFNFGASNNRFSSFTADGGLLDYFFIYDNNLAGIISAFARLTGRINLPPKWSLGYQQCRYSYYPETEVMSIADKIRAKQIPADAIVLDIHHMDQYKIFTWDNVKFPNPKKLVNYLRKRGFKVVVICDPGIKIESGYASYASGMDENVFIKYPDGELYEGEVWPGWCHFPDFTSAHARKWWAEQLRSYTDIGIEGFWNDMNEIATWGQDLPDLIEFEFDGEKKTSRAARNVYGLLMAKSTYEGAKASMKGKRPFNLTRAGFAGIQRYSAVWTGDNVSTDEHMLLGARMLNNFGLSGIPFAGYDAGGFVGNASKELFARWISMAAFSPFCRSHSNINTQSSEPWSFGERVEEIARNYLSLRYRLLPYLYASFYEASESGMPINRSLAIDFTHDELVYDTKYENEYLFGAALLVCPVSSSVTTAKIYLPEGRWFEFFSDKKLQGKQSHLVECPLEKLPLYVKASSIIPMQTVIQSTMDPPEDTLEIHLYKGSRQNSVLYYEDDGESFDHQSGEFFKRLISYYPKENQLYFGYTEGKFTSQFKKIKILFHGFRNIQINGDSLNTCTYRFVEPMASYDPIDSDNRTDYAITNLQWMECNFPRKAFEVTWTEVKLADV